MSYIEYHSGKLEIIPMKLDDSLEGQCKRIALKEVPNLDIKYILDNYDSFESFFRDNFYEEYLILNERIYKIIEHSKSDEDMFDVWENSDGTISFSGSFYNGGTFLNEMIEDGLRALKDGKRNI